MASGNPILPFTSAQITDAGGRLTFDGRELLRKIVTKLQGQINALTVTDGHIADLLASLTGADGTLVDLSNLDLQELAKIADLRTGGVLVRDPVGNWFARTLLGTTNRVSVTYGDGTADNPVFDISATYVGQASITTLGTITTGTWQGGVIAAQYGGTGQATYTIGDLLYASGTTALSKLPASTSGYLLTSNGAGVAPSWQAPTGITRTITSISSPTTAGAAPNTDYVYLISGTTSLTLPTAVGNKNLYTAKNVGVGTASILSTSAQTFDGSASPITIPTANVALSFISDGANWNIV